MVLLKRIKLENPNLYKTPQVPKIGDYILLGTNGFWEITGVYNGCWQCGGLKTTISVNMSYDRIFRRCFVNWLISLRDSYKGGDLVTGWHTGTKKLVRGHIDGILHPNLSASIWITSIDDGYTYPVNVLSVCYVDNRVL